MAVKDLVGLFETRSAEHTEDSTSNISGRRRWRESTDGSHPGSPSQAGPSSSDTNIPTREPVRFLKHPLPERSLGFPADGSLAPVDGLPNPQPFILTTNHELMTSTTTGSDSTTLEETLVNGTSTHELTSDVTDELLAERSMLNRSHWAGLPSSKPDSKSDDYEMEKLLPDGVFSTGTFTPSGTLRRSHSPYYALKNETASTASSSTAVRKRSSRTVSSPSLGLHKPIPATTIFSRKAAPLALPHLDEYISYLPAPSLPSSGHSQGKGKGKSSGMFLPMDRLAESGKSIEDLENNSQVAPFWRNRNTIFGALVSGALGITGSSALASFYSLHGLFDTIQIFALILNTIAVRGDIGDSWRKLIFGTIPNILAFNLATSTVLSLILLIAFMLLSGVLLYFFRRATAVCCQLGAPEGLQKYADMKNTWSIVMISFCLTVIYLPISTMAMHVLVWSEDLWVVPNPYINATVYPPPVPPLGPPDEFRDPLDFCWTTTMKKSEVNFAPIVIIIAAVCVGGVTAWFPIHLRRAVRVVAPKVDQYTELGASRSQSDMDREYQRLLARDRNPLSFLYSDFRRGWPTYESTTLFAKLTTLTLTAIIDPDNCLFRSLPRTHVAVARQIVLLAAMLGFFLLQCFLHPFLDPVNNASEWTSRLNFVLTSGVSLLVALDVPGKDTFNGVVLFVIYIITYGLSFYFAIINTSLIRRLIKRLARRIDFSIDIFSPRIDLSPSSIHTKRRIWQEAITTLLLTNPDCAIPKEQLMNFAQARDSEYPPYLLDFSGSPGERHVENLKILREIGSNAYMQAVSLVYGPDQAWFQQLAETIQTHFIGPDCYWKNPREPSIPGCTKFFGNAWWIPFPPTMVVRYDDGPLAVINEVADLQLYVEQNASADVRRRREIRLALRSLDGLAVRWPYKHIEFVGSRRPWFSGRHYRAQTSVHFRTCIFRLKRKGRVLCEDLNLGSGFEVELTYSKDVVVGGSIIGINDDFDLTKPLARFLALNENLVAAPLLHVEGILARYRTHLKQECRKKAETLTYRFLTFVYDRPREPDGLAQSSIEFEHDIRVRQLMIGSEAVFEATYRRLSAVATSELATWWYIFWDDVWRRNHDTISAMEKHASDFNPHYPSSIAYTPLPRPALEAFLTQRGLLNRKPKFGDFFHAGFLNKIYMRMNDIVFHGGQDADIIHLGQDTTEHDMEDVDHLTQARPSTLGTGGGTDHDDESIRARPFYRWEGILGDKLSKTDRHRPNLLAKFGVWFGVTPLWRAGIPSRGLALDVKLEDGRYVLLNDDEPRGHWKAISSSKVA